jgi:hypothetical protein
MAMNITYGPYPDTSAGPSPAIWGDCPITEIQRDPGKGYTVQDDFQEFPTTPTITSVAALGRYRAFASSGGNVVGGTMEGIATPGGVLKMYSDGDNEGANLSMASCPFQMSGNPTYDGKLWFEARVARTSITTLHAGFFVGLGETSLITPSATVPIAADGTLITTTGGLIGFYMPEANTTTASTVYEDRTTMATVGSGEVTGIAAATWMKLGFVYDPRLPHSGAAIATDDAANTNVLISFYLNGKKLTTGIKLSTWYALSYLNGGAGSYTTGPTVGMLGLIAATLNGASQSSDYFYMDWWRCVQLRPTATLAASSR